MSYDRVNYSDHTTHEFGEAGEGEAGEGGEFVEGGEFAVFREEGGEFGESYLKQLRNRLTKLMYTDECSKQTNIEECHKTEGCKYFPATSVGGEGCFFDSEMMQGYANLVCTKLQSESRGDLLRLAKYYEINIRDEERELSKKEICKLIGEEIGIVLHENTTQNFDEEIMQDSKVNAIISDANTKQWSMSTLIDKLKSYFSTSMSYVKALVFALIVVGILAAAARTLPYTYQSTGSRNVYINPYAPALSYRPPIVNQAQRDMLNFRMRTKLKGAPITCFISNPNQIKILDRALEIKIDYCELQTVVELFHDSLKLPEAPSSLWEYISLEKYFGFQQQDRDKIKRKIAEEEWGVRGKDEEENIEVETAARGEAEEEEEKKTSNPEVQTLLQHLIEHKTDWNSPQNPLPESVKNIPLNAQIQFLKILLNDLLNIPKNKKLTDTDDFKKTGLIIGQQLCGLGAFKDPLEIIAGERGLDFSEKNLSHCGIYIGNGLIWEVGGGEYTQIDRPPENQATTAGISSLGDWDYKKVYLVTTPDDANPRVAAERLARVIAVTGPLKYNIIWRNCQTLANYVSFGTEFSEAEKITYLAITSVSILVLTVKKLGQWALQHFRNV